jgi:hypothetical protein
MAARAIVAPDATAGSVSSAGSAQMLGHERKDLLTPTMTP